MSNNTAFVNASKVELERVFINLLANALHAVSDKFGSGIKEPGNVESIKVWINVQTSNDQVLVKIEDNGYDMTDETREKLFDPFYTTKNIGEGTGLGLAMSYGIINVSGGTIDVESKLGVGSVSIVKLPMA